MNLLEIASVLNVPCVNECAITGFSIDSRKIAPGNVFIAIRGERFDGHDFIELAAELGAAAVISSKTVLDLPIPQLIVPDTLQALAAIATYHRQQQDCQIIALTGSNGKTTVKEMIAAILPQPSFSTPGNLNNHIGVPLSVLKLTSAHRYAVFELGANHPGEIAHTVAIVQPQVTLINNIAPAHIEGFGSIDGVAHAKGEIYHGLMANGTAVINDDDAYAHFWDSILKDKNSVRFSINKPADFYAKDIVVDEQGMAQFTLVTQQGEAKVQLKVPGRHNVSNAVAAAACASSLGLSMEQIVSGLEGFGGVGGRMTILSGRNHARLIDDTYNANLRSVLTALDVLAAYQGKRIFVFGDMGELGDFAKAHHQEVGVSARNHGIDLVFTCGKHSEHTSRAFGSSAKHFNSQADLVNALIDTLDENTTVLVKGSRSAGMENIVQQLK